MLRRAVYAVVVIIVLIAALVLALRFALSQVSNYEDEIVAHLSGIVGAEVRVGAIRAVLSGVEPVVKFSEIHVAAPSGETLHAGRMHIEFNLWESLLRRRPTISDLRVGDVDLLIVTDADGSSSISSVPLPSLGAGLFTQPGSVQALPGFKVHFEQARVRWRNEQAGTDYEFENSNVAFEFADGRLRFAVKTSPPPVFGRLLHVAADLEDVGDGDRWYGRVYLRADQADLTAWARLLGREGAARGVLSAELWSDWRDGGLQRLDGTINCEDCAAESAEETSAQARLSWEAREEGWRLGLLDVALKGAGLADGLALEHSDIALVYRGGDSRLILRTPVLSPELLGAFSAMNDGLEVSAAQGSAALSAVIEHPGFKPPHAQSQKTTWSDRLEHRLRFSAEYASQYITQLQSDAMVSTARLELELQGGTFKAPAYSQHTLELDKLTASLRYLKHDSAHRFYIDQLSALIADARVNGRAAWLGGTPPRVQAAFDLEGLPLVSVERWLPGAGLNPRFKTWLERAFAAGVLKTGRFEFSGAPSSFPFRQGGGRLHFEGEISGAELNYRADRKPLRDLNAHVAFDNQVFVAEASNLRYYDLQSQTVRVVIQDVTLPFVEVDASGSGSFASVLAYLEDAQLINFDDAVIGALEAEGGSRLELSVKAPLSKRVGKPVTVKGTLNLNGASLQVAPDLVFSDIVTVLHFDRRGGRAESLSAKLNGTVVEGSVKPAGERTPGVTVLTLRGEPSVSQLLDLSKMPLHDVVEGTAEWQADLLIPGPGKGADYELKVTLASSLEGVTVKLPAPFNKDAAQRRDFSLELVLGSQNEYVLSYGEDIKARLLKDARTTVPWGYLHFGDSAPRPVERGVFRIGGELSAAVELDDWLELAGSDQDFNAYLKHADLSLAELRKGGETLGEASVLVKPRTGGRELQIAASWAQGWFFLPDADDAAVFAKMERLFLPKSTPTVLTTLNPASVPEFELEVADFRRGDMNVSDLRLITAPMDGGMRIGRLAFEAGGVLVGMSGQWLFDGQRHQSRIALDVNGRDYGKMLELLGFEGILEGGDGSLLGRVSWVGPPGGFSMEKLEGDLKLTLKNGVIEKADPGVGRLLGLFSVNHIVRRMTLDFRDILGKGLAFETMEGNLSFHNSVMHTEDFVIVGPAVSMAVSGDNFIAERRYEQRVDVVPHLSSGLPVAGALIGGPITGAAVLLIDKLTRLGSRMDKVVTLRYRLHGSWDDPQMDFEGAPGAGPGQIRKLLEKVLP